jgi:hypothetical protein
MKRIQLSCLAILTLLTIFVSPSFASNAVAVLNLEGNPTCKSLGDNDAVLDISYANDFVMGSNQVSISTVNPSTGNPTGESQTLTFTVDTTPDGFLGITEWNIGTSGVSSDDNVNPINYIILKAVSNKGGPKQDTGARVFHYGASVSSGNSVQGTIGSVGDEDLPSRSNSMSHISFCYGLTAGVPDGGGGDDEVPLAELPLPSCDALTNSDLYTATVNCPTGPGAEEQLIINMSLNKANFGFDFGENPAGNTGIRACTCNTSLPACNPELSSQEVDSSGQYLDGNGLLLYLDDDGNLTTTITASKAEADNPELAVELRSCLEYVAGAADDGSSVPAGVNERVPFGVTGVENPDSYVCYRIGGRRYCYGHY